MEAGASERGWLIEFLGGPWDRQTGLYDREPDEVIEAPLEPPCRYRLAVKFGRGQPDRLVQHLIYEADRTAEMGPGEDGRTEFHLRDS